eukprot:6716988-Pyramimonas_sp.AAC.1
MDARDGPQQRDGAKPSIRLGDEGHLGDEVGPLAPLLDHVKQVDHGLDAFVVHQLQLPGPERVEGRTRGLLKAAGQARLASR